eukprot:200537-Chlamydomonas_euryale.AAC.5
MLAQGGMVLPLQCVLLQPQRHSRRPACSGMNACSGMHCRTVAASWLENITPRHVNQHRAWIHYAPADNPGQQCGGIRRLQVPPRPRHDHSAQVMEHTWSVAGQRLCALKVHALRSCVETYRDPKS